MLRILITNDDGIEAPGIKHLWESLKDHAEITIIAPAGEQSATGLSITTRAAIDIRKVEWPETPAWSVGGTPADCIKLGLSVLLDFTPDLIVSGINRGSNVGRNILYSGTVGGAIEGIMHDVPAIAFSCYEYQDVAQYKQVEQFIPDIVHHAVEHPLPRGTLLNVNFPPANLSVQGFKMTPQGKEFWQESPTPSGAHAYLLGSKRAKFVESDDCDVRWLEQGYVTAVPLHVAELTDHKHINSRKTHFEKLFK